MPSLLYKEVDVSEQYKFSGWFFVSYGVFVLGSYLIASPHLGWYYSSLSVTGLVLTYAMIVAHCLSLFCGVYLLKHNPKVHKIALPVSIFLMLNFPFGTLTGGIYLYERFYRS